MKDSINFFDKNISFSKFNNLCLREESRLLSDRYNTFTRTETKDNEEVIKNLDEKIYNFYARHPLTEKEETFTTYLSKLNLSNLLHDLVKPFRGNIDGILNIHTELDSNKVEEISNLALFTFKNIFKTENISVSIENDTNLTNGTASNFKIFFDNISTNLRDVKKDIIDYTLTKDSFTFTHPNSTHVSIFIPRSLIKAFIPLYKECVGDPVRMKKLEIAFLNLFRDAFYCSIIKDNFRENRMSAIYMMMRHYRDSYDIVTKMLIKPSFDYDALKTDTLMEENCFIKSEFFRNQICSKISKTDLISPLPLPRDISNMTIQQLYNFTLLPQWGLDGYKKSMKIKDTSMLGSIMITNDCGNVKNVNIEFSETSSKFISTCILAKRFLVLTLVKTMFSKDDRNIDVYKSEVLANIVNNKTLDELKFKSTSLVHENAYKMIISLNSLLFESEKKLHNHYLSNFVNWCFESVSDKNFNITLNDDSVVGETPDNVIVGGD